MKKTRAAGFSRLLLGAFLLLLIVPAFGANPEPFVIHPDKFMVSAPLSETLHSANCPSSLEGKGGTRTTQYRDQDL